MPEKIVGYFAAAAGLSIALSLATISNAWAAPPWDEDAVSTVGPYSGYYGPAPYGSSYYNYYGSDDYVIARPAFPPGCGAGKPHC